MSCDRYRGRVDDESFLEVVAHWPAEDTAAEGIQHDREEEPALTNRR
jgi:hypothetical protein